MTKQVKPTSYKAGLAAETIAMLLLGCKCYRIIAKRYKTKVGEIDIIAIRGKSLVFIEVKKRRNINELYESITAKQKNRIANAAELFLASKPQFSNHKKRFDAILITPNLFPIHVKDAWVTY